MKGKSGKVQEAKKFRYEIAFKTNSDCLQILKGTLMHI